ncbi:MAG: NRDE family protein [Bacteroidota bacterium]
MCLITFAYHTHPKYKLILAANRDEFYRRPSAKADWWEDHPEILGGRDLQAMGTWMGINKNGRLAAVTNYRDLRNIKENAQSRGELTTKFLLGDATPEDYVKEVLKEGGNYNGFNLLVLDQAMAYVSNYSDQTFDLNFGIYGLSNALLDTPWPKVEQSKQALEYVIQKKFVMEDLFEIMQDEQTYPKKNLPDTGLSPEMEKALSAMHIRTADYGTCCTTALTIDYEGNVHFAEKSFGRDNKAQEVVEYEFTTESR